MTAIGTNVKVNLNGNIWKIPYNLELPKQKRHRIYFCIIGSPALLWKNECYTVPEFIKKFHGLKCYRQIGQEYYFYCYNHKILDGIKDVINKTHNSHYTGPRYEIKVWDSKPNYTDMMFKWTHKSMIDSLMIPKQIYSGVT